METTTQPIIGQYWQGHGGIYAGIMHDGERHWHLILAEADKAAISAQWGEYGKKIEGEFSRHDGLHNTQLILADEDTNKIANYVTALEIEGHTDFYWPAEFENNLICINLRKHISDEWHWSSTQYSALSAWVQHFGGGGQGIYGKRGTLAARAVRRELII